MKKTLLIVTLVCGLIASAVVLGESRTWTDSTGKYEIKGEFVEFRDGKVWLKKDDGGTIGVPMSRLSSADQMFVREELKRRREGASPIAGGVAAPNTNNGAVGDWPQWRGPARDGLSRETGLLDRWDAPPPILWQAHNLGGGMSSLVVADGRVFTMGVRRDGAELIALDAEDGGELWSLEVGGGKPNCTPTVDGDLVFALGRDGDLVCADVADGREIWRKKFSRDFGGKMMSGWGYSESPLVDGDRLICTPGAPDAMIAALDRRTGETIWASPAPTKTRGNDGAGYSSIVVSQAAGEKQYVQLIGCGVVGVRAEDGRPLWYYGDIANGTANVPTPIVKGDYIFCSSGYGDGGTALLKIQRRGDEFQAQQVYYKKASELQNHHGGMVLVGDYVYMGHGHNNGLPVCVELMTGRAVWGPLRGPGRESAAVVYADGHLYFRYQDGVMALIEATPEEYRPKGSFEIATRHDNSWPHPVIADGRLYLRDQQDLHVYDIRRK
ncbi:MAG: PQQ-binding-like beta-propeller repeat protein [Pirellulaceae bacterium]